MEWTDISEPLRLKMATIIEETSHGIAIRHGNGITGLAEKGADGKEVVSLADRSMPNELYVRSSHLHDFLLSRGFHDTLTCRLAVYRGGLFPENLPSDVSFRMLSLEDYPFLLEWYHMVPDPGYLKGRLSSGVMMGVWYQGKLAGFIGEHEEGAVGMLEILPSFRRHHLATLLERHYCNVRFLKEGRLPYCDIVLGNKASFLLHQQLGFVLEDDLVWWMDS
jgi:hypothetical protein